MFINRVYELGILNDKLDIFLSGRWQNTFHLAFLGLRRTGKTYLLNHFLEQKGKDVNVVYFNISKFKISPYSFSRGLVSSFLESLYSKKENIFDEVDDVNILKKWNNIEKLYAERKLDFAINETFELITYLSETKGKFVVVLDEFQDFFAFEGYPSLKNIEAIFRDNLENQLNIFYILSGSFPSILKQLLNDPKHYLYSHFEIIDIFNFDKYNSKLLIKKLRSDLLAGDIDIIFSLTNGNPYLIVNIASVFNSGETLKDSLKKFLFNSNGKIYNYFLYVLEESLNKIPGNTNLLSVLKELAINDSLTLTQISKNTYMDIGSVSKSMILLKKVDLVYQSEIKKWSIDNYIFKYFLKYYFLGIDDFESVKSEYYGKKLAILQEDFSKTSTLLGKTKEFELFYEIKENQDKVWQGIKIPKFKILKKNYFTKTGDEIDLYGENYFGEKWIFELKYKKKKVGNKEIKKFINKFEADKYIYISKSGFCDDLLELEQNNQNIFLIDLQE